MNDGDNAPRQAPLDVVLATDIGMDPDDFIALNTCLANPLVRLRAILVDPGTADQVGLVKAVLQYHDRRDVPIGIPVHAGNQAQSNAWSHVSGEHLLTMEALGIPVEDDPRTSPSATVLDNALAAWPSLTLVTIGPLLSLLDWLEHGGGTIHRTCTMGGYMHPDRGSGEYNFDAFPNGANALLDTTRVRKKVMVSANVTRSFFYTRHLHDRVLAVAAASRGHRMIVELFNVNPFLVESQMLHDPLATCVAIDESIVNLVEVHPSRDLGGWNAVPSTGTGVFMSSGDGTSVQRARFEELFVMHAGEHGYHHRPGHDPDGCSRP